MPASLYRVSEDAFSLLHDWYFGTGWVKKDWNPFEVASNYAGNIVAIREILGRFESNFSISGDEFNAAAQGPAEWHTFCGPSAHWLVFMLACDFSHHAEHLTAKAMHVDFCRRRPREALDLMKRITEADLAEQFPRIIGELADSPMPTEYDYKRLLSLLYQELCRAHDRRFVTKRSCSGDELPLPDEAIAQREKALQDLCVPQRRIRPAYERDNLWLDWRENRHWGCAKIRDHWDSLTDVERAKECPTAWQKVGGDTRELKHAGYETVKTALKKAKRERLP